MKSDGIVRSVNSITNSSRVIVVGTSGPGKTTLARKLGIAIKYKIAERKEWVIHGNYSKTRDIYWPQGTHLIWLEYSFWVVLWRVLKGSVRRIMFKEKTSMGSS